MSTNEPNRSRVVGRLGLSEPLSRELSDVREQRRDHDSWIRIGARLDDIERYGRFGSRFARSFSLGERAALLRVSIAAAMLVGVVIGVVTWRTPSSGEAASESAGLRLMDGGEFTTVHVSDPAVPSDLASVVFADGSSVRASEPDTHLEALAFTERDVVLRLVRGGISVQVTKGGPRQWTIEAGTLKVEVVGTAFDVVRRGERSSVAVKEGVVLVRSSQLPDGVRRLGAGEGVSLQPSGSAAPDTAAVTTAVETSDSDVPSSESPKAAPAVHSASHWFEVSDAARLRGDWATAAQALQTVLRQFPKDSRAELAAFQLAVVRQNAGLPKAEVVAAFTSALSRVRSASLRQDCYWRLVQLAEAMGDAPGARRWARTALDEYPKGRYSDRLRARLGDP